MKSEGDLPTFVGYQNPETMIAEILLILSSGILGLFLGAQLTEAILLVPFWKTMQAGDFFHHHKTFGRKIHQFFAPLTIAATLLPLATVGYHLALSNEYIFLFGSMGISTLAFFATYFVFFKKANGEFANRSFPDEELPQKLTRWGNWHWGRVCLEAVAFTCSICLLIQG